jgi:hypothetical protein
MLSNFHNQSYWNIFSALIGVFLEKVGQLYDKEKLKIEASGKVTVTLNLAKE